MEVKATHQKGDNDYGLHLHLFWCPLHPWRFCVRHRKWTLPSVCMEKYAPEEKEKIAIVPLCRNIGEIIALNGIIFLLKGLWAGFSDHWFVGAMVAWMIIAGFDVWYIEKSQRYRKK